MGTSRAFLIFSLTVLLTAILPGCASVIEKKKAERKVMSIADTNLRLGLGYLQQGRVEAALEKLQKAIIVKPDYAEAHNGIALAYGQLDENEKAEAHYLQAMELSPKDGSILNNYAVFLCGNGRQVASEKYFLRAIKSRNYRTPAEALENLGICVLQIPDAGKAEIYLRKALRMNPRLRGALLNMARISVNKGRAMSGRAYLQRYQELSSLGADGLWLGIQVEKKMGDVDAVRDYENRLHRFFPDSQELRWLLESQEQDSKKQSAVSIL